MLLKRSQWVLAIASGLSILFLYFNVSVSLPDNIVSAIHFSGFGILVVLMQPLFGKRQPGILRNVGVGLDFLIVAGLLLSLIYLILNENVVADRNYDLFFVDYVVGFMTIALGIELVRRSMGWIIPTIILIGVSYVLWWGQYVGGIFNFPGISSEYFLVNSYFGDNEDGLFGSLAIISWTMVFIFILFGAFLVESGAGDFIIRLANAAVGRFTGGPGLVAVLGSGLMGSVSGSAIANTTATGVITIPMMKKAGFPPVFAAAVEAGASTGGQLIPPIMGAGVFVMVSYTQVPYLDIISAAAIPGILYFVSIAIYVRIMAKKQNIVPQRQSDESTWDVFKEGWHYLLPMVLLVVMLVRGFTPTFAGGYAILSVVIFSWMAALANYFRQPDRKDLIDYFRHDQRVMGLKRVFSALSAGGKNCAMIAVLLVTISLFVNAINISGLSVTFSQMITSWAGTNLLFMILLVALASLVIGMGLPVTASYIVLATLCAPALYDLIAQHGLANQILEGGIPENARQIISLLQPDLGSMLSVPPENLVPSQVQSTLAELPIDMRNLLLENSMTPEALSMLLLSAHMIVFWLSQDSNVTPPVCLVAFAAAAIAKTPPMATGFEAWKTAKALYIIPVLFAYTPFIGGSWSEVLLISLFAGTGMYALVGAMYGYFEMRLNWFFRLLAGAIGTLLIWPTVSLLVHVLAIAGFALLFIAHYKLAHTVSNLSRPETT